MAMSGCTTYVHSGRSGTFRMGACIGKDLREVGVAVIEGYVGCVWGDQLVDNGGREGIGEELAHHLSG